MTDNTDGYIPAPDTIVRQCGLSAAYVWGAVCRLSHANGGVCWASQAAIGRRVGLCRATVNRHLRRLVDAGFLADLSPHVLGAPHSYAPRSRLLNPTRPRPAGPAR